MKCYKVELMVIDFDEVGEDGIKDELENANYGNDCIRPEIKAIASMDIGEWNDRHPLNLSDKSDAEYRRLFPPTHGWNLSVAQIIEWCQSWWNKPEWCIRQRGLYASDVAHLLRGVADIIEDDQRIAIQQAKQNHGG